MESCRFRRIQTIRKHRRLNQKGMTLVELLVVLVILGILSTIAMPSLTHVMTKSRAYADISSAELFYHAVKMELLMCRNKEATTQGGTVSDALVCDEPAELLLESPVKLNLYPQATFYLNVEESGSVSVHVFQDGRVGDSLYPEASGKYKNYSWR